MEKVCDMNCGSWTQLFHKQDSAHMCVTAEQLFSNVKAKPLREISMREEAKHEREG